MDVNSLETELQALDVQVLEHEVVLLGPRVAIALSAEAAAETARRLAEAAVIAAAAARRESQPSHTFSRDA